MICTCKLSIDKPLKNLRKRWKYFGKNGNKTLI